MSVARPARCLFCSFSRAARPAHRVPRRQFHLTPAWFNEKSVIPKPPPPTTDEGKTKRVDEIAAEVQPSNIKPYTEEEKAALSKFYTEEQIAAIEAGESAIDPKDMAEQFAIRQDPMKLRYFDDFSVVEPVVDKHIRAPESNSDYEVKLKEEEDFDDDIARYFTEMPEDATAADWVRWAENLRVTLGKEENERNPHSVLVPSLFKEGESLSSDPKPVKAPKAEDQASRGTEEMTDALKALLQATGYTEDMIRSLKMKTLVQHRVVNQTRLGKVQRMYCLSIAGNGNGLLGIGEAKSDEAADASTQSRYRAIRNMQPILRYENRTIFGDVKGKVGAVELKLMTRPPGTLSRTRYVSHI